MATSLAERGIAFESLDNGLLCVDDAEQAQAICDLLDAVTVDRFFRKWLARLPHPLAREDRAAAYRYQLSILQMEVSCPQVFDRPLAGRQFFEEVIGDNLDLGRPDRVQLIFGRRITRTTPGRFHTRILTAGVEPIIRIQYRNARIKQYFKQGWALRTETTFNDTRDFGVGRSLVNFQPMQRIGRNAHRRLINIQRLTHTCAVSSTPFERIVLPSLNPDGQRVLGLRFGDPRTMAVLAALGLQVHLPNGFSNRELRHHVAGLLANRPDQNSRAQMAYDLRGLRMKGLIHRLPGRHRYVLTPAGRRIALFFTKADSRVLRRGRRSPAEPGDPLVGAFDQLDSVDCRLSTRLVRAHQTCLVCTQ